MTGIAAADLAIEYIRRRGRAEVGVLSGRRRADRSVRPRLTRIEPVVAVGIAHGPGECHVLAVADRDVRQRRVAYVGHDIGPGHRRAHRQQRAGLDVGVDAVGALFKLDSRRRDPEVVAGIVGADLAVEDVRRRGRAEIGVLSSGSGADRGIRPRLARIEPAVAVGIAHGPGERHVLTIADGDVRQRRVSCVGHDIGPGHRRAHGQQRAGRFVGIDAVGAFFDLDARRDLEENHHIIAVAAAVRDRGVHTRVQEIGERCAFRQPHKRARHGIESVVVDDDILIAPLRQVAVKGRYVQGRVIQPDRARHVDLAVVGNVIPGRIAADFDVQ